MPYNFVAYFTQRHFLADYEMEFWSSLFTKMVETHKRKRKNTVITK